MLDCDVLGCWSNLTLVDDWHVIDVFMNVWHQIQLRIPDLNLSSLLLFNPLRLHLLLLSDNSTD